MKEQLIHMTCLAGAFVTLFVCAEILYNKYNVKVELTRKLVHSCTGLITLSFPFLFSSHWIVFSLCAGFLGILITSERINILQSVHGVKRKTIGAQLFPITVYLSFLAFSIYNSAIFYYLPILLLSICDPIAAIVGKRFPIGEFQILGNKKTIAGSFAFACSAMLITIISIVLSDQYLLMDNWHLILTIGVVVTLCEALVVNGYDNLTIPLSCFLVLSFCKPIIHLA